METGKISKSPVTALQEFFRKENISFPDCKFTYFPLIRCYECEFEFDKSKWTGDGNSKKDAKQSAALTLIKEKLPSLLKFIPEYYFAMRVRTYCHVNHLNNLCKRIHMKKPLYKCWRKGGPEHKRVYVSECFLPCMNYTLEAESMSKKDAKQTVAEKMTNFLLLQTNCTPLIDISDY